MNEASSGAFCSTQGPFLKGRRAVGVSSVGNMAGAGSEGGVNAVVESAVDGAVDWEASSAGLLGVVHAARASATAAITNR